VPAYAAIGSVFPYLLAEASSSENCLLGQPIPPHFAHLYVEGAGGPVLHCLAAVAPGDVGSQFTLVSCDDATEAAWQLHTLSPAPQEEERKKYLLTSPIAEGPIVFSIGTNTSTEVCIDGDANSSEIGFTANCALSTFRVNLNDGAPMPPAPPASPTGEGDDKSGLGTGAIIGIAAGAVATVGVVALLVIIA